MIDTMRVRIYMAGSAKAVRSGREDPVDKREKLGDAVGLAEKAVGPAV